MSNLPAYAQFLLRALGSRMSKDLRPLPDGAGPKNFVTFEAPTGHRTHVRKAATALKFNSIDTTYHSSVVIPLPTDVKNGSIVGYVPADKLVQHLEEMYADDEARVVNRGFGAKQAAAKISIEQLVAASSATEQETDDQDEDGLNA